MIKWEVFIRQNIKTFLTPRRGGGRQGEPKIGEEVREIEVDKGLDKKDWLGREREKEVIKKRIDERFD